VKYSAEADLIDKTFVLYEDHFQQFCRMTHFDLNCGTC